MMISTRHTVGGYRSAIVTILNEDHSASLRALALKSAFIWSEQALGDEFWHRAWARLCRGKPMAKEARLMLLAMQREKTRTLVPAEARDHDRILAKAVNQEAINQKFYS